MQERQVADTHTHTLAMSSYLSACSAILAFSTRLPSIVLLACCGAFTVEKVTDIASTLYVGRPLRFDVSDHHDNLYANANLIG